MLPTRQYRSAMAMVVTLVAMLLVGYANKQADAAVRKSLHPNIQIPGARCWPQVEPVFSRDAVAPAKTIQTPAPIGIPLERNPGEKAT